MVEDEEVEEEFKQALPDKNITNIPEVNETQQKHLISGRD